MKIPIRNLYYLFLYAWGRFPLGRASDAEIGIDESPDLPNLFARLLSFEVRRLLRRGLDRGYQTFTDEMIGPRGRIRLDRVIKEATQLRGTVVCDFDELTRDILLNQIVKATLSKLACCLDVIRETRHELRSLSRQLYDVADVKLSANHFQRSAILRNNREYSFVIKLCEFIFWSLMPDERGAEARFRPILEDEVKMSSVFECFLRNFYQVHRTEYAVRSESPEWHVTCATNEDLALLPRMMTDITLRHPKRTIIIDAKYYSEPLALGPYGERVRAGHLYQLMTYLQHERRRSGDKDLLGMLIYPDVGRSLRLRYRLLDIPVFVTTVDLGREWREIEGELSELLDYSVRADATDNARVSLAAL
jgi:5-methylcytosine-specific restriction enzyme subunit McrC